MGVHKGLVWCSIEGIKTSLLEKLFEEEEIKGAVWNLVKDKALSPSSFSIAPLLSFRDVHVVQGMFLMFSRILSYWESRY